MTQHLHPKLVTEPAVRSQPPVVESAQRSEAPSGQTAPRRLFPYRPVIQQATAMWLASRLAYAVFTYVAVMFQRANSAQEFIPATPRDLLYAWKQWDAVWYITIAQRGYWKPQATAFFPLYPTLIKGVTLIFGSHWMFAAMLVSNLGTLGAFIGMGLLATQEMRTRAAAWRTLRVFAAYPLAFFLVAPYTEGLFVAFLTLSFFCARRGSWRWAALWAFLSGLTRPTGFILVPALLWEFGRQRGWWRGLWLRMPRARRVAWWRMQRARLRRWWRVGAWRRAGGWGDPSAAGSVRALATAALVVGAVPMAILVYMAFLDLRFGHPLLWLHVQRIYWQRDGTPIWSAISNAIGQVLDMPPWTYWQARQLVDLAPVVICGALTVIYVRRVPFTYTLYMVGLIYLAVSKPVLNSPDPDLLISAGRFMIAAVPVFLILGQWTRRRPWMDLLLVSGGFLMQAVLAAFFLQGGWLI